MVARPPTSGLLLRQLPIEGIHTNWLSRHAVLLLALLGEDHKPTGHGTDDAYDQEPLDDRADETDTGDIATNGEDVRVSRRRLLHARLRLRVRPTSSRSYRSMVDPG